MKLLPCPINGLRPISEFVYGGEYREMPGLRLTRAEASRFWQVDETTCDAIVRALVIAHGGTVTATSRGRGEGSTFVVRLPLLDVGSATAETT